jgi:hypothetical protein
MSPDPETTAIFDDLCDARLIRVDAQLERIDGTAFWLGRQLARHDITRDEVNRRLDVMCSQRDPEIPDFMVALVPWDIARDAALAGLHRGMEADR